MKFIYLYIRTKRSLFARVPDTRFQAKVRTEKDDIISTFYNDSVCLDSREILSEYKRVV